MNLEDFCRLYDYNSWANRRTLEACAPLGDEQFTRDLHSSFRSVRDTLVHILLVEWLWRERWLGRSPDKYPPATDFPTLEAVRRRWAEVENNLRGYVSSLKPEDLDRVIEHKTTAGVPQAAPLSQMLQHLVNHGTYHRGQVATMLRQLEAKPIGTDLIMFYRERAAQAKAWRNRQIRNFRAKRPPENPFLANTMEIIRTISWMSQVAREAHLKDRIIGLIPTMGALHEGHFSLIRAAKSECSSVVVSIFVNPKQFGPSEDFQKYPRAFEADRAALENLGVDYLFAPTPEEMYPRGFRTTVAVEGLSDKLEGRSRPGHFQGVTTVVLKLLEIVQPNRAYFGRKDAQQARIIGQMALDLDLATQIVVRPILREPDGLALSSRNVYLNADERRSATALYRSLEAVRRKIIAGERSAAPLLAALRRVIDSEPGVVLDYAEIVDAETLEPVVSLRGECLILLAAKLGKTRLIDNALIEENNGSFRVTL